jgi:SAM-dependent methyltransferase
MMSQAMLFKLKTSITNKRGLWGTLAFMARNPLYLYFKYQEYHFDRKYNTDTSAIIVSEELDVPASTSNLSDVTYYEAITLRFFSKVMKAVRIDYHNCTFVDLGSGKGRALMLAAKYPFKKIVGVELSPALHETARDNLKAFRNATHVAANVETLCIDATAYALPNDDLVLFLYNPFVGKTMEAIVEKLAAFVMHTTHKVIIIYRNPKCASLFDKQECLELVKVKPEYRIYRGKDRQ